MTDAKLLEELQEVFSDIECEDCDDIGEVYIMVCYGSHPVEALHECPTCGSGLIIDRR